MTVSISWQKRLRKSSGRLVPVQGNINIVWVFHTVVMCGFLVNHDDDEILMSLITLNSYYEFIYALPIVVGFEDEIFPVVVVSEIVFNKALNCLLYFKSDIFY